MFRVRRKRNFQLVPWGKLWLRSTCLEFILTCPDFFLLCTVSPLLWMKKANRLLISSKYCSVKSLNVYIFRVLGSALLARETGFGRPNCPAQELTCPREADRDFVAPWCCLAVHGNFVCLISFTACCIRQEGSSIVAKCSWRRRGNKWSNWTCKQGCLSSSWTGLCELSRMVKICNISIGMLIFNHWRFISH